MPSGTPEHKENLLHAMVQMLLREIPVEQQITVLQQPLSPEDRWRSLRNIRPPKPVSPAYLELEKEYLQAYHKERGIVNISSIPNVLPRIRLWRGDITRLPCDAVVNAANTRLQGCYEPLHHCVDNQIHTLSGIELRNICEKWTRRHNRQLFLGEAMITDGGNLPAKKIIHTVAPKKEDTFSTYDMHTLKQCYFNSCALAEEYSCETLAFPCLGTGEFQWPIRISAECAISAVRQFLSTHQYPKEVVFCVFTEEQESVYREILENTVE